MLFQKNKNIWKWKMRILEINKKERNCSLNRKKWLFSPISSQRNPSGKVSFFTSFSWKNQNEKVKLKASLTVETALALPLFFLGAITMISFMDVYKIQTEHLVKLCDSVKTAGMYAYVLDGDGTEEISLPDIYSYKPVGGLFRLPNIWMYNSVTVHAWTGKSSGQGTVSEEEVEEMVYVTESGGVYHKDLGCSYLSVSISQVSGSAVEYLKNSSGKHYGACESCSRGQNPAAVVYVTEKGDSFHNQESCSALKRTVKMVKHSCTEGMAACSRCGSS